MKKIGRYNIVEELGHGAMGVVYKAFDPTIGRLVAIKVLSLGPATEQGVPGAREIFMREARAAGRLSHPNIVTIHDALEDPETHINYMVMEFVPGRTLENVLQLGLPLKTDQALEIARQIAEALDYAHREQVIHRDLKPANIILTEDGQAKITDFGIAKIVAREGALRTGAVMGTPSFMSPEQVIGGEVDGRSDLFSLGILLYVMLTGQKPFAGETTAVMFKIVYEDPVSPSQVNPRLGAGYDYLAMRCLVKDRNKRYASGREFLEDLDDLQRGRTPRTAAQFPATELRRGERTLISRASPLTGSTDSDGVQTSQKLTWAISGLSAGVVLLIGLVGWEAWRYSRLKPPPAPHALAQISPATSAPTATPPLASSPPKPAPREASTPSTPSEKAGPSLNKKRYPPAKPRPKPKAVAKPVIAHRTVPQQNAPIASSVAASAPGVTTASPRAAQPGAAGSARSTAAGQLWCRHELKKGTLTISSGGQNILTTTLRGKKKGGFLGIKGSYAGTLSMPLKIPPGARELAVRVVSDDGSIDLSKTVPATPPPGSRATLELVVTHDEITLKWAGRSHPTP